MTGPGTTSRLTLLLTNHCNMNCSYCYQRVREPRSMEWRTAEAAVDLLLSIGDGAVDLTFYGGEPLLEFDLLRRTVEQLERARGERPARYWLVTNGVLITDEIEDFLEEFDIRVQISFDGVPAAQRLREAGSFEALEGVLESMRRTHSTYFGRSVEVSITVLPDAIPFLADSVEHFLNKGVREIDMTPVITPVPGWTDERIGELEAQFERILASSIEHFERTGKVPLKLYSGEGAFTGPGVTSRAMCEIVGANSWAVDVDGTVSGCVLFAPSVQACASELLQECRPVMVVGTVYDQQISTRMSAFGEEAGRLPLVSAKEEKYSSYRRCADCRFLGVCVTCPVSIGFAAAADCHRIPDYYCAFNYTALASRDGFPVRPTDLEIVRGDRYRELREKWKVPGREERAERPAE
jgi:sulfatase maturation enzyme AslB (radical SAM superfamily)